MALNAKPMPTSIAEGISKGARPTMAVPCKVANKPPAATLPIDAYEAAAILPATGPIEEKPATPSAP